MLKDVITTFQEPTAAVRDLAAALNHEPGLLIVVGDRKGPARAPVHHWAVSPP